MADISMCNRQDCTAKKLCYRFTAPVNPHWQAYGDFAPGKTWGACKDFIPNKSVEKKQ